MQHRDQVLTAPYSAKTSGKLGEGDMGAYAQKNAQNTEISSKSWIDTRHAAFKDSAQGRAVIRLFSRGVLGAAFFTAGGLLNRRWLHDPLAFGGKYDCTLPLLDQQNPLKFMAKLIDSTAGKAIEKSVAAVAGEEMGMRAVRFRPTKFKNMEHLGWVDEYVGREKARLSNLPRSQWPKHPLYVRGRSLGNEAITITFDFFCASIGDAIGRDVADWFDPHIKKSWVEDGHIDVKKAVKQAVKSTWRYVTYNGGEDWAVAIPYAYYMKAQRGIINHFSPGFAYDFDRHLNGASFKTDEHGNVIGTFNLEGALDFQGRFTFYNIGTLMYREAYNYLAHKFKGEDAALYGDVDPSKKPKGFVEAFETFLKWTARSTIKGTTYMTPAMPFFWMTRVPQTKHRGLFINPQGRVIDGVHTGPEILSYHNPNAKKEAKKKIEHSLGLHTDKPEMLYANELGHIHDNPDSSRCRFLWSSYHPNPYNLPEKQFALGWESNPDSISRSIDIDFNPHMKPPGKGMVPNINRTFNVIGEANYKLARTAGVKAEKIDNWLQYSPKIRRVVRGLMSLKQDEGVVRFVHPFVYASASYTPYMYAKGEGARWVDNGKTDLAAERLIEGAANLNWTEFSAGAGELWRAVLHKPFKDPEREEKAQHRMQTSKFRPAGVNFGQDVRRHTARDGADLSWRDRVVQGRPEDKPEIKADHPKSYAEQEEMREALKNLAPPTNSVH